jgi:amidase
MTSSKPQTHFLPLAEPFHELTRDREPVLRVDSGDVIVVETEDAFSGQIRQSGERRDRTTVPYGNPVAGPILVASAEPGDTIGVTIEAIEPLRGQCATYLPPLPYVVEHLGAAIDDRARVLPIKDGHVVWSDSLEFPLCPMIGVLAVAPAVGAATSSVAGDFGGNLDLKELGEGALLQLPVLVSGALVYLGDCHAAQGDGESAKVALEMAARVQIRVELTKRKSIPGPRLLTESHIASVATGRSLESSCAAAFGRLALWLEEDFGIDRSEAYSLVSALATTSIGYFGLGVVAVKFPRAYLDGKT